MAATATEQVLNNGARNLVLKYTIGGTTGDASAATLVDVSALDATISELRLDKAQWSLTGFSAKLLWDADTDVDLLELAAGEGEVDFTSIGGLTDDSGTGTTGDVNITTTGYTASGDGGTIILHFRKKF